MKILFIGDIFGQPGRETVKKLLKSYKDTHKIDLVIANGENMKHGKGITEDNIREMRNAGVDFFTSGNHIWKEKSVNEILQNDRIPLIRPANYPPYDPGKGYKIIETSSHKKVLVINLLGRLYMSVQLDCPFRTIDNILKETENSEFDAIIVDFHAEATSEKAALAYYVDGKVSAVLGTHTHVQTNDARILPNGTGFMSDVGMTGPYDSIIGVRKDEIIENFLTQMPVKHEIPDGETIFNAVLMEIENGLTKSITPVKEILYNF